MNDTPLTSANVASLSKTPDCFCEAEFARNLERRTNDAEAKGKRVLARLIKAREFLPMDMRAYQEIQSAINELQQ